MGAGRFGGRVRPGPTATSGGLMDNKGANGGRRPRGWGTIAQAGARVVVIDVACKGF